MDNNSNNEKEPKIGWIGVLIISFILSIIFTGILAYSTDLSKNSLMFIEFIAYIIGVFVVGLICTPKS